MYCQTSWRQTHVHIIIDSIYRLAEDKERHSLFLRPSLEAIFTVVEGIYFISVLSPSCLQCLTDSVAIPHGFDLIFRSKSRKNKYVCLLTDCRAFSPHQAKNMSFGYNSRTRLVGLTTRLRSTSDTCCRHTLTVTTHDIHAVIEYICSSQYLVV